MKNRPFKYKSKGALYDVYVTKHDTGKRKVQAKRNREENDTLRQIEAATRWIAAQRQFELEMNISANKKIGGEQDGFTG